MKIRRKQQMQYENFEHFVGDDIIANVVYDCTVVAHAVP